MSGGVPVQSIDLDKLLKDGLTGGNSSLLPQSELLDGFQQGEEGMLSTAEKWFCATFDDSGSIQGSVVQ